MPYDLTGKLVVGISSRALFDLDEADEVFRRDGLAAYRAFQREHEAEVLGPGTAMPLIRGLLAIDDPATPESDRLVEVILLSRNDADSAMRLFHSIEAHKLSIHRGAFTSGRDPWPYLKPLHCSLFLSANAEDVFQARAQGHPAALVLPRPGEESDADVSEVRIAFDGDAVLFDERSELLFQREGLQAFQDHEAMRASEPLSPGPFAPFLLALKRIQDRFPEGKSPIRTALVTARGAPTHTRVVNTLRDWGVRVDETFFLGGIEKAPVLAALRPHIFFDDQLGHLKEAQRRVPAAHVVPERQQLALFADDVLPASAPEQPLLVLPPIPRRATVRSPEPDTAPEQAADETIALELTGVDER
ncbi:MAG TPA: 5'-nucleotidase [Candidatus Limnocylindria bacterium]|nr:5'-nucleotidase [Candidatus Limnocylindria bacterium]